MTAAVQSAAVQSAARTAATAASRPPFRADHVGSLLRPPRLLEARALAERGEITPEALQAVEDEAIAGAVKLQEDIGLRAITDGEYRRTYFHLDFLTRIDGMESYLDSSSTHFHKANGETLDFSPPKLRVTGPLGRRAPIMRRDYEVIADLITAGGAAKITIPSPTMALRGGRAAVDSAAYPDLAGFHADLAAVYREEIHDLAAAGCRYLQLDDTNLAYLCDETQREAARRAGQDPETLPSAYARLINEALASAPAEMFTAIHLCRGNFKSAFVAEGGYDPVAETLFNEIDVDAFLLEYDDARSGTFEPLRFLPKGKCVVLGLISSKVPELETRDEIIRRVEQAARFAPLEQLCLSPQCGFSSTCHGNAVSEDDQRRKLELVVACAEEIWGEA